MSRVLESKPTERGFLSVTFHDHYGAECSVQESSLASDDCIWLGTNDANPAAQCYMDLDLSGAFQMR